VLPSLKFNSLGDKFGGLDAAGNFFLWKFQQYNKYLGSVLQIPAKGALMADFCFMNEGSVIASVTEKTLTVFDIFLPQRSVLAMS